jgi:hypothetical protein
VRGLVSWLTDTAEDAFDLVWQYDLPPALATRVRAFAEQRDVLKRAQEAYEQRGPGRGRRGPQGGDQRPGRRRAPGTVTPARPAD